MPRGSSRLYLSVYSPLLLQCATIDGQSFFLESERERGRGVFSAYVDNDPGATRTLTLDLGGVVLVDRPYRLDLHRQPSAVVDTVTVKVERRGLPGLSAVERRFELASDTTFEVSLVR